MSLDNPLMAAFAEQMRKRYLPEQPDSFWSCEPLFRHLADPSFSEQMINDSLRQLTLDPVHTGDWTGQQVVLARRPSWILTLHRIVTPFRYIHSSPSNLLVASLGGLPLAGDLYDLPSAYNSAVFDPSLRLDHAGSFMLNDREVLAIRADRHAVDLRVDRPLTLLRLASAPLQPFEWLFSKETLHPWQAKDAEAAMTNLRISAHVLGRLAHQSSLEPVKALTGHPNPNVRMAALHSLGRISRVDARKALQAALDDPHPGLRRLAKQALDDADLPKGESRSWR